MGFIGEMGPWGWYKLILASGGEVLGGGIIVEGAEEAKEKDIAEPLGAVYCGNFSLVFGDSLVFVMLVEFCVKWFSLHLSTKGGFVINRDLDYVAIFLFNYY